MTTTKDAVISGRIPTELKREYNFYVKEMQRTPASILKELIENFVEEQEALRSENYRNKLEESRNSKRYSADEAKKMLWVI